MRAAIYFTPESDAPLAKAAAAWLGRSPYTSLEDVGSQLGCPSVPGLVELTASPRRYGFHATLKAPFALAEGRALPDLDQALLQFCEETAGVQLPVLTLALIGSFFALVPDRPCAALNDLAAQIVRHFEPFRAPLSDADLKRRRKASLSPAQDALLQTWGYPYVFDEFRYHMTVTGPVPAERQGEVREALLEHFAEFLGQPLAVDALALFIEPETGSDFTVHARHQLRAPLQD